MIEPDFIESIPQQIELSEDISQQIDIFSKERKEKIRDELFDRIVNSGINCYVALRQDFVKENYFHYNLFCGQVAEIENVILEKNKKWYSLSFKDYKNNENEYAHCLIEKKDLLPLFCFHPDYYKTIETKHDKDEEDSIELNKEEDPIELNEIDKITIHEIRNIWEEKDFNISQNDKKLSKHTKLRSRFKRGHLVTVLVDFKKEDETDENEDVIEIQAGQVGIISNDKKNKNNLVEVTFWSIPFGRLPFARKKLVSSPAKSKPSNYAINPWEIQISIHKDYLFPLYFEELKPSI